MSTGMKVSVVAQAKRVKPKSQQPALRTGILRFFHGILRELSFWLTLLVALGMVGALFTFDPRDPAWTQTAQVEQLHNVGGSLGAWFADVALYFFGYPAILLPFGVAICGWRLFKRAALLALDAEVVLLRVLGFGVALANACALASLHLRVLPGTIPGDNAAGGLVGVYVAQFLTKVFGTSGGNLFMGGLLLAGLTLMTGMPWLTMIDLLGAGLLKVLDGVGWLVMTPLRLLSAPVAPPTHDAHDAQGADWEEPSQPAPHSVDARWQATRSGLERLRANLSDYMQMLRSHVAKDAPAADAQPQDTLKAVAVRLTAVKAPPASSPDTLLPNMPPPTAPQPSRNQPRAMRK